jgi:hypothetical protein
MKPHQLIEPCKGDKRFTEMAKRAAALKKSGHDADAIVAAIEAEFGPPPRMEHMRDEPQPFRVYGEIGSDIEAPALGQIELALRLPIAVRAALGVIPGSMGTASYLVAGRGEPEALSSASHGAGRRGSRTQARNTISPRDARDLLKARDIMVEGFSVDESPQAYKDIERVMSLQVAAGLIEPLARMRPIAVIMAGEPGND